MDIKNITRVYHDIALIIFGERKHDSFYMDSDCSAMIASGKF